MNEFKSITVNQVNIKMFFTLEKCYDRVKKREMVVRHTRMSLTLRHTRLRWCSVLGCFLPSYSETHTWVVLNDHTRVVLRPSSITRVILEVKWNTLEGELRFRFPSPNFLCHDHIISTYQHINLVLSHIQLLWLSVQRKPTSMCLMFLCTYINVLDVYLYLLPLLEVIVVVGSWTT